MASPQANAVPIVPPDELRALIAEERERRRIAGLLHDGVGQTLVLLRRRLAELADMLPGEPRGAATACVALVDEALAETRSLTFELSPPVLDELGLRPGLHWLADDLAARYGRRVDVVDDGREPAIAPGPRTVVFRVLRELVINAIKHTAPDAEIVVSMRSSPGRLRAIVRDTGAGFDVAHLEETAAEHDGLGLRFARRQVRGLGGRLELHSEPGGGTRAALDLPLAGVAP